MLLVIDTNILLHCNPLHEIDWTSYFDSDRVDIVLCSTVLGELDDKKNDSKTSDRAKAADRMLQQYEDLGDQVRPNVQLRYEESDFDTEANNDAKILRCAKNLSNPSNRLVCVLTNDGLMRRRAKPFSIKTIQPEVEWMKPSIDRAQRERQKLENEVSRLKNRMPKLRILVAPPRSESPAAELLVRTDPIPQFDIDDELSCLVEKYPKIDPDSSEVGGYRARKYNTELDYYYHKMRQYYEFANTINSIINRSILVRLYICNSEGTVPANNVRARIDFGQQVEYVTKPCAWRRWKDGHIGHETAELQDLFGPAVKKPSKPKRPTKNEFLNPLISVQHPLLDHINHLAPAHSSIDVLEQCVELWANTVDHCSQYRVGSVILIFSGSYPKKPIEFTTTVISNELVENQYGKILIQG